MASTPMSDEEILEYNIFTKLKDFIGHYGHEAIDFIKCMGPKSIEDCGSKILSCVATRSPLPCITALSCEGKDAKLCAHLLKEKEAASTKKP
ncbi:hypothetical protein TYRP_005452 [Tyrophagus putrescentiae]|nr:hypothetical protein TYRP_005452 [Tyrophagus putrescentiae]